MKVLFAVNDEKIPVAITRKYQMKYKEIISGKNVYYFNAIIKELQKDKSYDRIVISEDLEPYSNKNYDMIDKFIFDKLDNISDEASNSVEGEIPIILIGTDRREKGEAILSKLFSIGIYSTLLGQDRSIDNVCELINKPRSKKDAKLYYKIDTDASDYERENSDNVSETEIQNILTHYKKLGKNEDRYVDSFNNIASQYTDGQLKLIVRFLPLNVKAVLEESCPKYQEVMMGSVKGQVVTKKSTVTKKANTKAIGLVEKELNKSKLTQPVVIPSTINATNVRKTYAPAEPVVEPVRSKITKQPDITSEIDDLIGATLGNADVTQEIVQPVKRGRGRPAKQKPVVAEELEKPVEKKRRGRPRKLPIAEPEVIEKTKLIEEEKEEPINLFGLEEENSINEAPDISNLGSNNYDNPTEISGIDEENFEEPTMGGNSYGILPGLEDDELITSTPRLSDEINQQQKVDVAYNSPQIDSSPKTNYNQIESNRLLNNTQNKSNVNLSSLLTGDKKIVSFVGTSKNGTSFLINNLATMLSGKGINTAILDLTKNKNAYYIYTNNDENLRNTALNCIENLRKGTADGIKVNRNLTVYTTVPRENNMDDYGNILETLVKNYSLVLLDCDFDTNYHYFEESQETYLVQTYDILTIQPLTAFLKGLKDKNVLDPNKLKVVINKSLRVKNLTDKMIIGGISSYNDPGLEYMSNLFNKDTIPYAVIPFENQTYSKYLEGLVNCEITINGYSKMLLEALARLGDMVYPLISSRQQNPMGDKKNYNNYNRRATDKQNPAMNNQFSSSMDSTLNKMRKSF